MADWYRSRFGVELDPDKEVVPLIGSKEGIAHMSWAFIEPGDVALVPDPAYPVYGVSTLLSGGTPYMMPLLPSNDFMPDLDSIPAEVLKRAKLLWTSNKPESFPMHGPVMTDLHVDSRGCFVPCGDNRLYAYDRLTGKPLWDPFVCQGALQTPVQVGEATIFQLAARDKFYAIDIGSGTQRWTNDRGRLIVAALKENGNQVCMLDFSDNLHIVDEMNGQDTTKQTVVMSGFSAFAANAVAPAIYAGTADGRVVCIRTKSAGQLTRDMLKMAPPASR
jgi:outer membrane protein assembly factor BamB